MNPCAVLLRCFVQGYTDSNFNVTKTEKISYKHYTRTMNPFDAVYVSLLKKIDEKCFNFDVYEKLIITVTSMIIIQSTVISVNVCLMDCIDIKAFYSCLY